MAGGSVGERVTQNTSLLLDRVWKHALAHKKIISS